MTNVRSAVLTHPGRQRPNNEDFITFFEPIDPDVLRKSGCIYILADGVGGASKGERASQYAAQKILHDYYKFSDMPVESRLQTIIRQAGNDIYDYALSQDNFMQMATTVVVAVVRDSTLQVAHVGDSRAYLVREDQVIQLTRDHSTVGELMRDGLLNEEEAMHFDGRNPLSRSLGGQRDVPVDVTEPIQFLPGDRILLSSDGLTRYATRKNINDLLNQGEPDDVVYRMIDFANQSGGADNISVIIIEALKKDATPAAAPRGQKPTPVDWDTIPTLPQNFVYQDKSKRKIASYAHKKKKTKLPYLLVGMSAVILIITGFVLGGTIFDFFNHDNTAEILTAIPVETQSPSGEAGLITEPISTETFSPAAIPVENTLEGDPAPEENDLEHTATTLDPTVEQEPEVTAQLTESPTNEPAQIGFCTYKINVFDLQGCIEKITDENCKRSFRNAPQTQYVDLWCLLRCKFIPDLAYEKFPEYAKTIISEDYEFSDETFLIVNQGWSLKFPNVTRNKCENEGGVFEPEY